MLGKIANNESSITSSPALGFRSLVWCQIKLFTSQKTTTIKWRRQQHREIYEFALNIKNHATRSNIDTRWTFLLGWWEIALKHFNDEFLAQQHTTKEKKTTTKKNDQFISRSILYFTVVVVVVFFLNVGSLCLNLHSMWKNGKLVARTGGNHGKCQQNFMALKICLTDWWFWSVIYRQCVLYE